ncbi:MAG: DUF2313 domain-containing protein [Deltaproteobacteria bacterium]|nr:DUF2313 domain-containing protein [Deltaproteobacteria bacterium]
MGFTDNLDLYLKFDNSLQDDSPNNFTVTSYNGSSFPDPAVVKLGTNSRHNDGISAYEDIEGSEGLNPLPITFGGWVRPESNPGKYGAILNKYNAASGNGYSSFAVSGSTVFGWYFFSLSRYCRLDNYADQQGDFSIPLDEWSLVIHRFDSTGGKTYIGKAGDDSIRLQVMSSWVGPPGPSTSAYKVNSGWYRGSTEYLKGYKDELFIYSRGLTDGDVTTLGAPAGGEIAQLWNNGNGIELIENAVQDPTASRHADILKKLFPVKNMEGLHDIDTIVEGDYLDKTSSHGDELLDEMLPQTTGDLIGDWERITGVSPNDIDTIDERREQVVAKLRARGRLDKQYFIDLAAAYGYSITIEGYKQMRCGEAECGDVLAPEEIVYVWKVIISEQNQELEALFNKLKPAYALVEFEYTG